jgi:aspartate aminotransferase
MAGRGEFASRVESLPSSVLHDIHRLVEQVEGDGRQVLRLHVGEPGFGPPAAVRAAVAAAVRDGHTAYTSAEGLSRLRKRIAEDVGRRHAIAATPDQVVVTPGSTQALVAIMLATCDDGDEVLIPETHWPIYRHAAGIAGLRTRFYPLGPRWALHPELLLEAATPATRLVIVNSPANPTGSVTARQALHTVVSLAHRNAWWLVGDEAYEHFVYEGHHVSAAALERDAPSAQRRVFAVHTFSKSYAMTGYRIGYVVAPSQAAAFALRRVQEASIVAPSTPIQYGALAALDAQTFPSEASAYVQANRDAALGNALSAAILESLPASGWYALLDIARSGLTGEEFTRRLLLEAGVAVAPGSAFVPAGRHDPRTVRMAFCGIRANVVEGIERFNLFLDRTMNQPTAAGIPTDRLAGTI